MLFRPNFTIGANPRDPSHVEFSVAVQLGNRAQFRKNTYTPSASISTLQAGTRDEIKRQSGLVRS